MRSRYEIRAQKELEADGWVVDWKVRPYRPPKGYSVDFFGLFDLIATKSSTWRFISIKGTKGILKKHLEKVKQFPVPLGCTKEIWSRSKGKTKYWHKIIITSDGEVISE